MRKIVLIAIMFLTVFAYSQKKKNGTIYKEHPAIDVVEAMLKAFVEGDEAKVADFLADDFKSYNGSETNKEAKAGTKDNFLNKTEQLLNNKNHEKWLAPVFKAAQNNDEGWFLPHILDLCRRDEIHEIASHGYTHIPFGNLSIEELNLLNSYGEKVLNETILEIRKYL